LWKYCIVFCVNEHNGYRNLLDRFSKIRVHE
jgi:hypothetical protein